MSILLQPVAFDEIEILVPVLLDADEGEERVRATLADRSHTTYAALMGEELVGAATVCWDEHESEIVYIAVVSRLRSRGYGKSIIAALLTEMDVRGVHSLLVGTANSSLANIAFYQKCGFRMHHIRRNYFNYIQPPIQENGIPMLDMLVLCYEL